MPSSTSDHGSFDRGLLAVMFTGIIGAPLLWLIAEQAGYTLAYQACDTRSNSWVLVPTFTALALTAIVTAVCAQRLRRAERDRLPLPLLGWAGVLIGALITIVLVASAIAPMMLLPCD